MNATKAIIALFERNKGSDPMSHWAKRQMSVDEAARAIYELWGCTEPKHMDEHTRAILHGVANDALERAALAVDDAFDYHGKPIVERIRALKHSEHVN
jgi:hypothetical protein